jgi:hypothetical protein
LIDPNQAEYAPVTGQPGRYYTPDRSMTVGVGYATPSSPPQSEQQGRGLPLLQPGEFGGGDFPGSATVEQLPPSQPQYDQYGAFPSQINDLINSTRMQSS